MKTWLLIGAGALVVYVAWCWLDPMTTCWACHGSGISRSVISRLLGYDAHHRCWWCKGEKEYPRLGARVMRGIGRNRR